MSFLGELDIICPTCNGRRFNDEILQVKYKDKNFIDILNLTVDEARSFFMDQPKIKKILDKISDFGLGANIGIPRYKAKIYIEKYFQKYPKVKEFMDNAVKECREKGYSVTMWGRKREVPEINAKNYNIRHFF